MKKIKPRRIFEELAEAGVLADLLEHQWREFYEKNETFRDDVNEIMLKFSKSEVTLLEKYYLQELCNSLQFFIDYTKIWTRAKQ
ncbi:MAG: hypothetical protein N2517_07280 [Ignavibacteria bacterium]|nr:hypothetical protein [Ignavibacteria bacterium]